jgi:hypothetical protein
MGAPPWLKSATAGTPIKERLVWTELPGAVQTTMILLYLSIPFMLIGITIAVVPLWWAMTHSERLEEATICTRIPHQPDAGVGASAARPA